MKARLYEIGITTDLIHGWTTKILEVYIPKYKLSFNHVNDDGNHRAVNLFRTYPGRYTKGDMYNKPAKLIKTFEISQGFGEELSNFFEARELFEKRVKDFWAENVDK
jgi:hypothetical protein